jgi:hypothetical protein
MPETQQARLVLAIVRGHWDDASRLAAERPVDSDAFVDQCRECDVLPWVHHLLTTEDRTGLVGAQAIEHLGRLRTKVRNDTMLLLARAEQALDALIAAGVTPIALKGLDFLHRLYPTVDRRTVDDVDLLVRRRDLTTALEALRDAGWQLPPDDRATHYIRSSHHLPLRSPGPITVDFELHWSLAQEERYRIDTEGLFERARPLEIAGRHVLRLDDHDAVAHLLIHHFSHYFDRRLKWLVDLQLIAESSRFDWETVAGRVRGWGGSAAAGVSLAHLRKLSPQLIPDAATHALPFAAWRRLLALPLRSTHPLELFRGTRNRRIQLFLAALMLENPARLPAWLRHRAERDNRPSDHPLDQGGRREATRR